MVLADTAVTEQLRSHLAAELDRRTKELVDAVSSAVFSRIPPYQQLARPGTVDAFRADIRALLGFAVGAIAERRPLRPLDLDRLRRIGAERARQGLPLDAVVDALEVGTATCWRVVREELVRARDQRAATALAADLAMETHQGLKVASAALATGHASEEGKGTHQRARIAAEFVVRTVDGTWADGRDAHRAAEELGVELPGSWLVLLVTRPHGRAGDADDEDGTAAVLRVTADIAGDVPEALVGPVRTVPVLHAPILLPVRGDQGDALAVDAAAEAASGGGLLLMASDPVSMWRALPVAYRAEVDAIPCARAAAVAPGVLRAEECHLFRLLRTVPLGARAEYVHRVLGPVLELSPAKTTEALATLEAFFRGRGRLDESAADLRMHRNSYRYRFERAQSLLGLNFHNGRDRLRVEVALALRRLDDEETFLPAANGRPAGDPAREVRR